jgi:hypothetical protein
MITDNTTKAGLMSRMEAVLSDTSQVWLTSYFGFTPADWGFFSFTDKGRRDTVVEQNLSKSVPVSSGMKPISTRHFKPVQTHNFTPRHAGAWAAGGAFSLIGMSSLYAQRLMASTIRITL